MVGGNRALGAHTDCGRQSRSQEDIVVLSNGKQDGGLSLFSNIQMPLLQFLAVRMKCGVFRR